MEWAVAPSEKACSEFDTGHGWSTEHEKQGVVRDDSGQVSLGLIIEGLISTLRSLSFLLAMRSHRRLLRTEVA